MILLYALLLAIPSQISRAQTTDENSETPASIPLPRAEKGDPQAQYAVGNAYFSGQGVPRDFKIAADWLRKAAVQGHTKSMVLMGLLSSGGRGVPLDSVEALKWYTLAAERGNPEGKQGAAALSQILTPDQVQEGRRRALQSDVEFLPAKELRAKTGDLRAEFETGLAYYRGLGVAPDFKKAFHWFSLAAAKGLPEAENNLGNMYELGQGVKKDYAKAMSWFRKAAASLPQAEVNIGGMYYKGEGIRRDIGKAFAWNESAAHKGSAEAYHNLGSMCYNGLGAPKDPVEACKWFLLAASRGDSAAQRNVAQCSKILTPKQWDDAQARATHYSTPH